jgi:hypothetical protein
VQNKSARKEKSTLNCRQQNKARHDAHGESTFINIYNVKMPIKVGKYVKLMPVDCEPPATGVIIKNGGKKN